MDFSDILLTVDFDRTMTAMDSSIPERNLEAVRYFMEQGGSFTVNTGRSLPMSQYFTGRVPVNAPLLLCNGSIAYDTQAKKLIFSQDIPLDLWKTVQETAGLFPDLVTEIQGLEAHYTFRQDPLWQPFCAHNGCEGRYVNIGDELGPFLKFSIYGPLRDVTVADLYSGSPEELRRYDRIETVLRERFGEAVEVFRAAPRIIDVHARGISKLNGARKLQKRLGKKLLICVGDGDNDIPMLEGADYAFCPADAIVAERFPNVCACGEGAVADVIYKKIPEILRKMP